jgi:hypothetical protein
MNKSNAFLLDAGVAGGLVLALLIVIGLDKLISSPAPATQTPLTTITNPDTPKSDPKPLRIAVTPTHNDNRGKWDDMNKLLDSMGKGYKYTVYPLQDLPDAKKLEEFDVLFLTCAPGGTEPAVTQSLSEFVGKGGTLYASDWRYDCVAKAFPDFKADNLVGRGKPQRLEAKVIDPGLRDKVGATIPLRFDLSKWKTAAFGGDRVKVLIEGEYEKEFGGTAVAPLLVKFHFGKGNVIFTSFHNEKQNDELEVKLLKYLVFSAVTAKTEAQITQTMVKGGFSPQKSNLLSASSEEKIEHTYQSKKGGKLRFVLGFEDRGASLKLTVTGPDGKTYEQTGTSTISIDVPQAPVGAWRYTVTPLRIPYPDFPFTLTVGESE